LDHAMTLAKLETDRYHDHFSVNNFEL